MSRSQGARDSGQGGHRRRMLCGSLTRGGTQVNDRKTQETTKTEKALALRSRRIHTFLDRWARRHMPDRVTRFTSR